MKNVGYRQTKMQIAVCNNGCYNWFHGDKYCLKSWINELSGLKDIDTNKQEMTNEDFLALDFSKIRKYTDYQCPVDGCDGHIVGMKTMLNIDGEKRRHWNRHSDSSQLYDMYYKESGIWAQTWKKYINDQIKELKKDLSWRCFDNTKTFVILGDNTWRNRRRNTTERKEYKRIVDYARSHYRRNWLKPEDLGKLKEINSRRRLALVLMMSDPNSDITKIEANAEPNVEPNVEPKLTVPDPAKENEVEESDN